MKRVLYIQFTNPGGYPPLEHSSRILAEAGWDVLFLGTGAAGAGALAFPAHPRIEVRKMPFPRPGWRQKTVYFLYCLWVFATVLLWRPRWVYVSDPLVCPCAALLTYFPGLGVIYHEHDAPSGRNADGFFGRVLAARRATAQRAQLCVIPNEMRRRQFEAELGPLRRSLCVWNCPRRDEVLPEKVAETGRCTLAYHGSIVPDRLPPALIHALAMLPDHIALRITGYETVGSKGYVKQLTELAGSLGIGHRIEYCGTLPLRSQLMGANSSVDIGLAMTPMQSDDANFQGMSGASNKVFDYLACGLAVIVSDLPDWRALFVEPGYGLAVNPQDPESIAAAVGRLAGDAALRLRMGEAGRQRVLAEWNYDTLFAPVQKIMTADGQGREGR